MKVILLNGQVVDARIKRASGEAKNWTNKTAHWIDRNGAFCSVLVIKTGRTYTETLNQFASAAKTGKGK